MCYTVILSRFSDFKSFRLFLQKLLNERHKTSSALNTLRLKVAEWQNACLRFYAFHLEVFEEDTIRKIQTGSVYKNCLCIN